jgi:hypothetical protein
MSGTLEHRQARVLGERWVGFREGAEVEIRAAVGLHFTGVAAIEAEAYAGLVHAGLLHLCLIRACLRSAGVPQAGFVPGVLFIRRHGFRLPYTCLSLQPRAGATGTPEIEGSAEMAHLYARSYCTAMVQVLL